MENLLQIPEVKFKLALDKPDIEVLELDSFYQRFSNLEHHPAKPHRIEFHCLLYINEGEGTHFIDFVGHKYTSGTCIFVNRHQVHAFDFQSAPKGHFVLFTEAFIDSIRSNIRAPLFTPTHLGTASSPTLKLANRLERSCQSLMLEISDELNREDGDDLLIQMLFSSLILKLHRERTTDTPHMSERRVVQFNQFIQLLEANYPLSRDASFYADRMHVTYKSLNQVCKLACNKTAKQLIDAHVILEAKRRLAVENTQVQQLAYSLGFDEVTNFIKYFKRHTKLTPVKFKLQFNNEAKG